MSYAMVGQPTLFFCFRATGCFIILKLFIFTFKQKKYVVSEKYSSRPITRQPFQWNYMRDDGDNDELRNSTISSNCQNSQQGKLLIVDDRGTARC